MPILQDKVALITGARNGIGRATVERFLKEGAKVVALDLAVDETFEHPNLTWVQGSASSEADLALAVEATRAYGGFDICIANAGVGGIEEFVEGSRNSWMRIFDINLLGVMLTLQAGAREMIRYGRGGRLLVTASIAGLRGEMNMPSTAYAASKGAVIALTRAMSMELAEHRITVNAVAPGQIDTLLNEADHVRASKRLNRDPAEARAEFLRNVVPLRRMGTPAEVAGLYTYLASDEATFVTGTTLRIDGGELAI
jgi:NAD(P)-dependent dehydrogenase (short-subunit alcohol dehydrogenase family)